MKINWKRILFIFPVLAISSLLANPSGSKVISGNVSIAANNKDLFINASDKSIIHWQDFSIKAGEITKFVQPSTKATVLNRVVGNNFSKIMGKLESNGHVFLINPSGIIVKKDAIIDTAAFTASTLNLSDEDFLRNTHLLFEGLSESAIVNFGTINAWDGDVTLLGYKIENYGDINSPKGTIALGMGQNILLRPKKEEKILIKPSLASEGEEENFGLLNEGKISALQVELKADGNPYSYAIKHKGNIHSYGIEKRNGKVLILAEEGRVETSGEIISKNENGTGGQVRIFAKEVGLVDQAKIDVSADKGEGIVLIGGDYKGKNPNIYNAKVLYVSPDSIVDASALKDGNGGKIIFWSDETTRFYGKAFAKGGEISGEGGFVETSSLGFLDPKGLVDTTSKNGDTGIWLLDPSDITISGGASAPVYVGNPNYPDYIPAVSPATLNNVDLQNGLGSNNVIVDSSGAGGGVGNITVSANVVWNSAYSLTLDAVNNIIVNRGIRNDGTGEINLIATNGHITIGGVATEAYLYQHTSGNINITTLNAANGYVEILGSTTNLLRTYVQANSGDVTCSIASYLSMLAGTQNQNRAEMHGSNIDLDIGTDLTVRGGIGGASQAAYGWINASNQLTIDAGGVITFTGGNGISDNQVIIRGDSVVIGATTPPEQLIIEAGTTSDAYINASFLANNSSITLATGVSPIGTLKLDATTGGASTKAYIVSNGYLTLDASSLEIYGGDAAGGDNQAYIDTFYGLTYDVAAANKGNVILQGGTNNATNTAYIETTNAGLTINIHNGTSTANILLDTTGKDAPAYMTGINASLTCDNLNITAGGASAYIELLSWMAHTITCPVDVTLQGGTTDNAHAEIFVNNVAPSPVSSLTMNITGNLGLTGGTFGSILANRPNAVIRSGLVDVDINVGGNLTLQGSNVINGGAAYFDINNTGAAAATVSANTMTLTAGTSTAGGAYARMLASGDLSLETTLGLDLVGTTGADRTYIEADNINILQAGNITITAVETDTYMKGIDSVTIGSITPATSLTIQGGSAAGGGAPAYIRSDTTDVLIRTAGNVSILGGTNNTSNYAEIDCVGEFRPIGGGIGGTLFLTGNIGYAQITTGSTCNVTAAAVDMQAGSNAGAYSAITPSSGNPNCSITTTGNVDLKAGTNNADAYIDKYTVTNFNIGGDLALQSQNVGTGKSYMNIQDVTGTISANNIKVYAGNNAGAGCDAYIISANNLSLTTTGGGFLYVTAGSGDIANEARLEGAPITLNVGGDVQISGILAPAYFHSGAGGISITTGGNLDIDGGNNTAGYAEITSIAGLQPITLNIGTHLKIIAGDTAGDPYAAIYGYNDADITIVGDLLIQAALATSSAKAYMTLDNLAGGTNFVTDSVTILGGNSASSGATALLQIISGDLRLEAPAGVIITGGTGHNTNQAGIESSQKITLDPVGNITMQANLARSYIECGDAVAGGGVTINSSPGIIQLTGGTADNAHAEIYALPGTGPDLEITALGALTLTAGTNGSLGSRPDAKIYNFGNTNTTLAACILQGSNTNNGGAAYIEIGETTGGNRFFVEGAFRIFGGQSNVSGAHAYLKATTGDLHIEQLAGTELRVEAAPTLGHIDNYASIETGANDLYVEVSGDITVKAYEVARAFISGENIYIGNTTSVISLTVQGGDNAAGTANAAINANTNFEVAATGSVSILGGDAHQGNYARVLCSTGSFRTRTGSGIGIGLNITGGDTAPAYIETATEFNVTSANVTLTSGAASTATARIYASGGFPDCVINATGDVTLDASTHFADVIIEDYTISNWLIGGTLLLHASDNAAANAIIDVADVTGWIRTGATTIQGGAFGGGGTEAKIISTNEIKLWIDTNDLTINGGTNIFSNDAFIYPQDKLTVLASRDIIIQAGESPATLRCGTNGADITCSRDMLITGGVANGWAGLASWAGWQPLTLNVTGNVTLTGGTGVPGNAPNATISGFTSASVTVGGEIKLEASPVSSNGRAYISLQNHLANISCDRLTILGCVAPGTTTGFAYFEISAGSLSLEAPNGITITGGTSDVTNYARLTADGDMTIGPLGSPVGSISLTGQIGPADILAGGSATAVAIRSSGDVTLTGGTSTDAHARIYESATNPTLLMDVAGNLTLQGGAGAGIFPNAYIEEFGSSTIDVTGNMSLLANNGVNGGAAYVHINATGLIGAVNADSLTITGSDTATNGGYARIRSINSDLEMTIGAGGLNMATSASNLAHADNKASIEVLAGNNLDIRECSGPLILVAPGNAAGGGAETFISANDISIGSNAAIASLQITAGVDSNGESKAHITATDDVTLFASGALSITGGANNATNYAEINCGDSFLSGGVGDVTITGGALGYAQITTIGSFEMTADSIQLNGGSNSAAYARIYAPGAVYPNCFINTTIGNFEINGGSNNGDAYLSGYTVVNFIISQDLILQGNNLTSGAAYIQVDDVAGTISARQIELNGGNVAAAGSHVNINSTNNLSLVTTSGDVNVTGGLNDTNNTAIIDAALVNINSAGDVHVVAQDATAEVITGIGGVNITAGDNLILYGGVDNAVSQIRSTVVSQPITLNLGGNLELYGGSGVGTPSARISTNFPYIDADITIAGTLQMTASPLTSNGFVSIELVNLAAGTNFNTNNILMTGGTTADPNTYALLDIQAGDLRLTAPAGIVLQGGDNAVSNYSRIIASGDMDIGFPTNRVGTVRIIGGDGAPALIEASLTTTNFSLYSAGNVILDGGTADFSSAQIFHSGGIFPNLTMDISGNMTLTGGSTLGGSPPSAWIFGFDNVNMNIIGALTLRGRPLPSPHPNGGSAIIQINATSSGGAISAGSILLEGGETANTAVTAQITSNIGNLAIESTSGGITIRTLDADQTNRAFITSANDLIIRQAGPILIEALGGPINGASAYMSSTNDFYLGTIGPVSSLTLRGGSRTGGIADAVIYANNDFIVGTVTGAMTLNAGTNDLWNRAYIEVFGSFQTNGSIGSLNITGDDAFAGIETTNNFSYIGGPVSLTGGVSLNAHARIFTTNLAHPNFSMTSSGNVSLIGGINNCNAAIEGYTLTNTNIAGTLFIDGSPGDTGNAYIDVENVTGTLRAGTINLNAGSSFLASTVYILSNNNLNIETTSGGIDLTGGANNNGNFARLRATLGALNIQSVADVFLAGNWSQAEIRSSSSNVLISSSAGSLTLEGGDDPGGLGRALISAPAGTVTINMNNITLVGGDAVAGNIAEISMNGNANITASNNFDMQANSAAPARITTSNGSILIDAGNDINMEGDAQVIVPATGNELREIAGNNMNLLDTAGGSPTIQNNTAAGPLYLVVDNQYPAFPYLGTGAFNKQTGATITTGGGPLYIYTSRRPLNSVNGNINGVLYVPGPEFQNSATEEWFHYYPGSPGGFPFTIYYKDFHDEFLILHEGIVQGFTALTEMGRMLHEYSEFISTATEFKIFSMKKQANPNPKVLDSFSIDFDEKLYFLRKRKEPNEVKITKEL